jgi:HTH-type transcriptional regulator, transcriptional repressor of NAD biosynthesis genes
VTTPFGHGLVVGKFYPPHLGHDHLIDAALDRCERLTVVVAGSVRESIPVALRAQWLAERHPRAEIAWGYDEHPIDYDDPAVWDAHMAVFRSLCPDPVDAVFSSEAYGDELARRFGATSVVVDRGRAAIPVSATAIRADIAGQWAFLGPAARAHLTRRVSIVGAESTGTTTLARALAAHYDTEWVPEYGREFTEQLLAGGAAMEDIEWRDEHFVAIASEQQRREDAAARRAGPVLICDTDALATAVWQERYLGASTADVRRIAASRSYALYIVTGDEIAFEQDGMRDGEHIRAWMTKRFAAQLADRPEPWLTVSGTHDQRLATATAAIDKLLADGWRLAPPR